MSALKELRKKAGLTLAALASQVGTSPAQISRLEKGRRKLTREWADRLAPPLKCLPQDLIFGEASGLAAPPQASYSLTDSHPLHLPRDVPVFKAIFDESGRFCGLNGEPIDYIRRLPRILHVKGVFALYAENNGMAPRFEQGDILYVNPAQPPKSGDYAVIELHQPARSLDDRGYIKRLTALTPHKTIVEQINPPRQFELDNSEIKAIFRIIPWNELAGG